MSKLEKTTAITKKDRIETVQSLLEQFKPKIAASLPNYITPERMLRVAMTAIQRNPKLLECTQYSLVSSVIQSAQLGLSLDEQLGQAYLVPFKNKKTGKLECQFMPGYKGLIELAYRSEKVSLIYANIIYQQDEYEYEEGITPRIFHKPNNTKQTSEDIVAVYAIARLKDGTVGHYWMWRHQIEEARSRSNAKGYGPWVTDYEEMAKKTAIRRIAKVLPSSAELQRAVALDELADAGIPQVVDMGEAEVIEEAASFGINDLNPEREETDSIISPSEREGEGNNILSDAGEPSPESTAVLAKMDKRLKNMKHYADDVRDVAGWAGYDLKADPANVQGNIDKKEWKVAMLGIRGWYELRDF